MDYFGRLCKTGVPGTVEERPELRTEMEHIIVCIDVKRWLYIEAQISLMILREKKMICHSFGLNWAEPGMFPSKQ